MPFLILTLFSCLAFAQANSTEQPQKESSTDLRNTTLLFSIEEVKDGRSYRLERTPSLSHFLRMTSKGEESVRKIDGKDAGKLDMDFASRFLKIQYEIPSAEGDCKVTLRLNMKGESQDVCQKDDKKTQEIMGFVNTLSQRF